MVYSIGKKLRFIGLLIGFSLLTGGVEAVGKAPTCNSQHKDIGACKQCCAKKKKQDVCMKNCNKGVRKRNKEVRNKEVRKRNEGVRERNAERAKTKSHKGTPTPHHSSHH